MLFGLPSQGVFEIISERSEDIISPCKIITERSEVIIFENCTNEMSIIFLFHARVYECMKCKHPWEGRPNSSWYTDQAVRLFRRRLRAEGAKPKSNKRWKTGLGHVCIFVCFFTYISQFTAHTELKSVPFASPLNATLLRNEFSWVRYPTSAWHVKIAKKSTKIPECSPRSPLSGRLCRDVTPAARFLYPL